MSIALFDDYDDFETSHLLTILFREKSYMLFQL